MYEKATGMLRWSLGFIALRELLNHRNLFLTKLVIDLAVEVVGSERHRTPKDPTWQTKGEFY